MIIPQKGVLCYSPKQMKILYLVTKSNWGGAQKYVYDLAVAAQERGLDVAVAAGGTGEKGANTGHLFQTLAQKNIKTITIRYFTRDIFIFRELLAFMEVLKIIKQEKPAVLHVNSSKAAGMGSLAGRILGVKKIIFTVHGWPFKEKRFFVSRALIYLATWVTGTMAHKIIVISKNDYESGKRIIGFKNKIELVYNGIAEPALLSRAEAREKLGLSNLPNEAWALGTIAELHPNKMLDTVVKALAILPPTIHYAVIGGGEEKEKLETLAKNLKVEDRLHLLGFVPEAAKHLPAFDAFVLPSFKEGHPYVLLESGLASLPSLGSNIPGTNDILDNKTGYLFPVGDHVALAEKIKEVMEKPEEAKAKAEALKQKISTEFSQEKMLDQTFALYK